MLSSGSRYRSCEGCVGMGLGSGYCCCCCWWWVVVNREGDDVIALVVRYESVLCVWLIHTTCLQLLSRPGGYSCHLRDIQPGTNLATRFLRHSRVLRWDQTRLTPLTSPPPRRAVSCQSVWLRCCSVAPHVIDWPSLRPCVRRP